MCREDFEPYADEVMRCLAEDDRRHKNWLGRPQLEEAPPEEPWPEEAPPEGPWPEEAPPEESWQEEDPAEWYRSAPPPEAPWPEEAPPERHRSRQPKQSEQPRQAEQPRQPRQAEQPTEAELAEQAERDRVAKLARRGTPAVAYGDDNTKFLWHPYLPVGEYSVLMAAGGVGKTSLCCGLAAAVSAGLPLPGEEFDRESHNVLMISGEDTGETLKMRLKGCGANLKKVFILDCSASVGMDFSEHFDEFRATVLGHAPQLLIVDPWQSFLGPGVNIDKVNVIRPVLQKLSILAKEAECAMILVSHVNKRPQGENANNAAQGSADFINASRSAFQVIFDGDDKHSRVMVHTKSNHGPYGPSVRFHILEGGGLAWDGFSDITRQTLELAARSRSTPWEIMEQEQAHSAASSALIEALKKSANSFTPTRFTYEEFKQKFGELIFGGMQPKRALDGVKGRLAEEGYFLRTGSVRRADRSCKGFVIQRIDDEEPEQIGGLV